MKVLYTDKQSLEISALMSFDWMDPFRDIWKLRNESPDTDWDEALTGIRLLILGVDKSSFDRFDHAEDLRRTAVVVRENARGIHTPEQVEALFFLLIGDSYGNPDTRRRYLGAALSCLRTWHLNRKENS
jgi:hypothetical protein|nr:MAG TPA: hypothetical protein [Caudoviricetes sp.]